MVPFPASGCWVGWPSVIPKERGTRRQLVGQAELLPIVLSQQLWGALFRERRALIFVDNDAARHAIIEGASPSGPSAVLVDSFWTTEVALGAFSWIERVPSPSNPANSQPFAVRGVVWPGCAVARRGCGSGASLRQAVCSGLRRADAACSDPYKPAIAKEKMGSRAIGLYRFDRCSSFRHRSFLVVAVFDVLSSTLFLDVAVFAVSVYRSLHDLSCSCHLPCPRFVR